MVATVSAHSRSLSSAKRAKNDEFYTRIEDIERELQHYRQHFRDKTVFLNCDDPEWSNFWRFFELNFEFLGLRKLIATHYHPTEPTYQLVRNRDSKDAVKTPLRGNGDFRSPEAVALLDEADIVVTNPPFSLFREYIAQLVAHDKRFLILGNMNAITYKEVWPLIQYSELWLGTSALGAEMLFSVPDQYAKELVQTKREGSAYRVVDGTVMGRIAMTAWFTNLDHSRRHEELVLFREYSPADYPHYDNYDAITHASSSATANPSPAPPAYYSGMSTTQDINRAMRMLSARGYTIVPPADSRQSNYKPPTGKRPIQQRILNAYYLKAQDDQDHRTPLIEQGYSDAEISAFFGHDDLHRRTVELRNCGLLISLSQPGGSGPLRRGGQNVWVISMAGIAAAKAMLAAEKPRERKPDFRIGG